MPTTLEQLREGSRVGILPEITTLAGEKLMPCLNALLAQSGLPTKANPFEFPHQIPGITLSAPEQLTQQQVEAIVHMAPGCTEVKIGQFTPPLHCHEEGQADKPVIDVSLIVALHINAVGEGATLATVGGPPGGLPHMMPGPTKPITESLCWLFAVGEDGTITPLDTQSHPSEPEIVFSASP